MNINDLSTIVQAMQPLMPETSRTELAFRFAALIEKGLVGGDLFDWHEAGLAWFLSQCGLTTLARPAVPYDCQVEETKLAAFCAKWISVSEFKMLDEPEDALRPITVEMHGLRASMINELKMLAGLPEEEQCEEVK